MRQTKKRRETRREAILLEHSNLMKNAQTEITARFNLFQIRTLVLPTFSSANQIALALSDHGLDQQLITLVVRSLQHC